MFLNVRVLRETPEGTWPREKREWSFDFDERNVTLYVAYYACRSLASARHKNWTEVESYGKSGRTDGKRLDEPPLPEDVAAEARQAFLSRLTVVGRRRLAR